jgi:outer membrane receptor protein involved in Fe transport
MFKNPMCARANLRGDASRGALLMALAASFAATAVHAQTAQGAPPAATGAQAAPIQTVEAPQSRAPRSDTTSLEEVTVTARKVKERLIDVPVVASVMSAVQLTQYNTTDLEQLDSQILGLHIYHADGGDAGGGISIRGVGQLAVDYGAEEPVVVAVDGMAFVRGHILDTGFFDMQSLEVLKGPQSLFFGKNSPAGVLNVSSNNPGEDWAGYVKAGYEFRTEDPTIEGAVNIPITDKLKMRVAMRVEDMQGGWLQNDAIPVPGLPGFGGFETQGASYNKYPQTKEFLGRVTLAYNPNDRFSLNFKVFGSVRHDDDGNAVTLVGCGVGNPNALSTIHPVYDGVIDTNQTCTGHLSLTTNDALASQAVSATLAGVPPGSKFYMNSVNYIYTLNMSYKFDLFDVTSTTGAWDHREREYTGYSYDNFAGITSKQGESGESWEQEIRVHTDFNFPINGTIGGFFEKDQYGHYAPIDLLPLGPYPLPGPYQGTYMTWNNIEGNSNESYSFFFQGNWKILPNLELAGGGRWSHETRHAMVGNAFNAFDALVAEGYLTEAQNPFSPAGLWYHPSTDYTNFSPEATLSWHPEHNLMIYGAYKTGYLAAGISNPGSVPNLTRFTTPQEQDAQLIFGGETVKGFEAGAKGTLLDGRLSGDFDVYRYIYNDLQVAVFNPQTISFSTQNAASAINEGVEFQGSFRVTPNLSLRAGFAYNHLAYQSYTNAQCNPIQLLNPAPLGTQVGRGQCVNVIVGGQETQIQDYSGYEYGEGPFQEIIGAAYTHDVNDKWACQFSADATFFSRSPTVLGQPGTSVPAYSLVNMSLKTYQKDGPWTVSIIATNITNTLYVDPIGNKPLGEAGDLTGYIHPPREVTLQVMRTF